MTIEAKAVSGDHEYTVRKIGNGYRLVRQSINPKTGKAWQRVHYLQAFEGERAKEKAMWAWCKLSKKAG